MEAQLQFRVHIALEQIAKEKWFVMKCGFIMSEVATISKDINRSKNHCFVGEIQEEAAAKGLSSNK